MVHVIAKMTRRGIRTASWAALLVVSATLGAPAVSSDEGPLALRPDRWTRLETPNFVFFSDAGERSVRRVAFDLEQLRSVLARYTSLELNSPVPTNVYLFRNDRSFEPYTTYYNGKPAATAGYFMRREEGNYIAINGDSRLDASAIVYHEYVHYFVANNLHGIPLWLEEGLAELYQSFRVARDTVQLGFPEPGHLFLLKTSPTIPLAELLQVDHRSPLYNERDRKSVFYAQSWALTHYLLVGSDERRPEALEFVRLVTGGVRPDEAFRRAFSTDVRGLEDELKRYVDRSIFRYLELGTTRELEVPSRSRAMTEAEVLFRLGDLLAQHEPARPEAADHFRAVLRLDPGHGRALAGLAALAERRARWREAADLYRRALEAEPADPQVQYRAGSYLLQRGADLETARAALERAARGAPSFGPAWAALVAAYLAAGDTSPEALEAAETAHRLLPSREDVTNKLLRLYLANDRRQDAVELAQTHYASDQGLRTRSLELIVTVDIDRAHRRVAEGRVDEAESILAAAEEILPGDAPESLRTRIREVSSDIRERRNTRAYNAAVAHFNRGEVEAARAILLQLEPDVPPGAQRDAVQDLLRLIDDPSSSAGSPRLRFVEGLRQEDLDRLNALIARGDLEEAAHHLRDLEGRVPESEHFWIESKLAEIESVIEHNAVVEAYNLAVDQYNAGAYADAVSTLEKLVGSSPEAPLSDRARQLLEEARAALAAR